MCGSGGRGGGEGGTKQEGKQSEIRRWSGRGRVEEGRSRLGKMKAEVKSTFIPIPVCTCSIILAALSTGSSGMLYSCVLSSSLCCRDFTRPLHSP